MSSSQVGEGGDNDKDKSSPAPEPKAEHQNEGDQQQQHQLSWYEQDQQQVKQQQQQQQDQYQQQYQQQQQQQQYNQYPPPQRRPHQKIPKHKQGMFGGYGYFVFIAVLFTGLLIELSLRNRKIAYKLEDLGIPQITIITDLLFTCPNCFFSLPILTFIILKLIRKASQELYDFQYLEPHSASIANEDEYYVQNIHSLFILDDNKTEALWVAEQFGKYVEKFPRLGDRVIRRQFFWPYWEPYLETSRILGVKQLGFVYASKGLSRSVRWFFKKFKQNTKQLMGGIPQQDSDPRDIMPQQQQQQQQPGAGQGQPGQQQHLTPPSPAVQAAQLQAQGGQASDTDDDEAFDLKRHKHDHDIMTKHWCPLQQQLAKQILDEQLVVEISEIMDWEDVQKFVQQELATSLDKNKPLWKIFVFTKYTPCKAKVLEMQSLARTKSNNEKTRHEYEDIYRDIFIKRHLKKSGGHSVKESVKSIKPGDKVPLFQTWVLWKVHHSLGDGYHLGRMVMSDYCEQLLIEKPEILEPYMKQFCKENKIEIQQQWQLCSSLEDGNADAGGGGDQYQNQQIDDIKDNYNIKDQNQASQCEKQSQTWDQVSKQVREYQQDKDTADESELTSRRNSWPDEMVTTQERSGGIPAEYDEIPIPRSRTEGSKPYQEVPALKKHDSAWGDYLKSNAANVKETKRALKTTMKDAKLDGQFLTWFKEIGTNIQKSTSFNVLDDTVDVISGSMLGAGFDQTGVESSPGTASSASSSSSTGSVEFQIAGQEWSADDGADQGEDNVDKDNGNESASGQTQTQFVAPWITITAASPDQSPTPSNSKKQENVNQNVNQQDQMQIQQEKEKENQNQTNFIFNEENDSDKDKDPNDNEGSTRVTKSQTMMMVSKQITQRIGTYSNTGSSVSLPDYKTPSRSASQLSAPQQNPSRPHSHTPTKKLLSHSSTLIADEQVSIMEDALNRASDNKRRKRQMNRAKSRSRSRSGSRMQLSKSQLQLSKTLSHADSDSVAKTQSVTSNLQSEEYQSDGTGSNSSQNWNQKKVAIPRKNSSSRKSSQIRNRKQSKDKKRSNEMQKWGQQLEKYKQKENQNQQQTQKKTKKSLLTKILLALSEGIKCIVKLLTMTNDPPSAVKSKWFRKHNDPVCSNYQLVELGESWQLQQSMQLQMQQNSKDSTDNNNIKGSGGVWSLEKFEQYQKEQSQKEADKNDDKGASPLSAPDSPTFDACPVEIDSETDRAYKAIKNGYFELDGEDNIIFQCAANSTRLSPRSGGQQVKPSLTQSLLEQETRRKQEQQSSTLTMDDQIDWLVWEQSELDDQEQEKQKQKQQQNQKGGEATKITVTQTSTDGDSTLENEEGAEGGGAGGDGLVHGVTELEAQVKRQSQQLTLVVPVPGQAQNVANQNKQGLFQQSQPQRSRLEILEEYNKQERLQHEQDCEDDELKPPKSVDLFKSAVKTFCKYYNCNPKPKPVEVDEKKENQQAQCCQLCITLNEALFGCLSAALSRVCKTLKPEQQWMKDPTAVIWVSLKPVTNMCVPNSILPVEAPSNDSLGLVYAKFPIFTCKSEDEGGIGNTCKSNNKNSKDTKEQDKKQKEKPWELKEPTSIAHTINLHNSFQPLKNSPEPFIGGIVRCLFGLLPKAFTNLIWPGLSNKVSMSVSSLPGPRMRFDFAGSQVEEVAFWVPPVGTLSLFVTIVTFDGDISIALSSDGSSGNGGFDQKQLDALSDAFCCEIRSFCKYAADLERSFQEEREKEKDNLVKGKEK